ncbi:MAG: hypothetical protein IJH65_04370 [Methanobrevibacter sp.]|nr:hypothetical protein [Methanobrevibacter sp.]
MAINVKTKAKIIIITFLTANKGVKYTGREIVNFVIENRLLGRNGDLTPREVNKFIKKDVYNKRGLLKDVLYETDGHRHKYWVE